MLTIFFCVFLRPNDDLPKSEGRLSVLNSEVAVYSRRHQPPSAHSCLRKATYLMHILQATLIGILEVQSKYIESFYSTYSPIATISMN